MPLCLYNYYYFYIIYYCTYIKLYNNNNNYHDCCNFFIHSLQIKLDQTKTDLLKYVKMSNKYNYRKIKFNDIQSFLI